MDLLRQVRHSKFQIVELFAKQKLPHSVDSIQNEANKKREHER
jgi:hypothetical protein